MSHQMQLHSEWQKTCTVCFRAWSSGSTMPSQLVRILPLLHAVKAQQRQWCFVSASSRAAHIWALGDSSAYAVTTDRKAQLLIKPHNTKNPAEVARMKDRGTLLSAGGDSFCSAVGSSSEGDEVMAVSRFFGAFYAKKITPGLSCTVEFTATELGDDVCAVVIASNGIGERLSPKDIASRVCNSLSSEQTLDDAQAAAEQLVHFALASGSTDNCSAAVLRVRSSGKLLSMAERLALRKAAVAHAHALLCRVGDSCTQLVRT